ncbi:nucleotide-binding domain containing protein, partial [Salinarimonas soli]
ADTARLLVEGGVTRLVVAGGETSGAVVSALGLDAVAGGPEIDPGVPALASPDRPLALALKSGNFGAPDFFAKALAVMPRDACPVIQEDSMPAFPANIAFLFPDRPFRGGYGPP